MKFPCSNCGKPVERKPSHAPPALGLKYVYCSRRCQYEHKRKIGIWKAKKCENCNAPIRKGRRFCSLSCYFRWMWTHTWADKRTNEYEPSKKKFVTIILRVPQPCLTNFEMGLRNYIAQFSKDTGTLTGKTLVNIIGERRLKAEWKETEG